jgi:hypothetical protein
MSEVKELKIKDTKKIYQEVEGTKDNPVIGIRYPGKKVKEREGQRLQVKWANLFDFEVVPFKNKKEITTNQFTFSEMLKDFDEHKKDSPEFWQAVRDVYYKNTIDREPPELLGINSKLYLLVLKWIWIQEDFNYKYSWEEVSSPIRYRLENRTGATTQKGAGRTKFFAALFLVQNDFALDIVKKIIPLY